MYRREELQSDFDKEYPLSVTISKQYESIKDLTNYFKQIYTYTLLKFIILKVLLRNR